MLHTFTVGRFIASLLVREKKISRRPILGCPRGQKNTWRFFTRRPWDLRVDDLSRTPPESHVAHRSRPCAHAYSNAFESYSHRKGVSTPVVKPGGRKKVRLW